MPLVTFILEMFFTLSIDTLHKKLLSTLSVAVKLKLGVADEVFDPLPGAFKVIVGAVPSLPTTNTMAEEFTLLLTLSFTSNIKPKT